MTDDFMDGFGGPGWAAVSGHTNVLNPLRMNGLSVAVAVGAVAGHRVPGALGSSLSARAARNLCVIQRLAGWCIYLPGN